MRITGGGARGISLQTAKGSGVRPATDRLREAVFSSLGSSIEDSRFVDLFAGSGAYGLDAWSRGAAEGVFVEKDRKSVLILKQNLASVARSLERSKEKFRVIAADIRRWQPRETAFADLIFVDPPYDQIESMADQLFSNFSKWIAPGGQVVFEMPGETDIEPFGWEVVKRLGKGRHQPCCRIYRRIGDETTADSG